MSRSNWPAVSSFLDALGRMPATELVHGMQARYLHHELSTVLGIAEATLAERIASSPVVMIVTPERMAELRAQIPPRTGDMADMIDAERAQDARR